MSFKHKTQQMAARAQLWFTINCVKRLIL